MKWDHTFNDRLSSTLNLTNSNYYSKVESFNELESFAYQNTIKNYGLKYDLNYTLGEESKIVGGIEMNGTVIEPGKLVPEADSENVTFQDMNNQRMLEGAIFLQGDFKLSETWSLSAGLRFSQFLRVGEDDIYVFDYDNIQGRYPVITDTIHYSAMK